MVANVLASVVAVAAAHPCRAPLPRAPELPAPLVAWSSCGAFRVGTDGAVTRLPRHWLARHGGGTGRRWGATLEVRRSRAGRYVLREHGRLVWRSSGLYPDAAGDVAFGPGEFAFAAYRRGVYLTDLGGAERPVARGRGLYPYDFTSRGDLLVVGGRTLLLIARDGRTLRRLRYRARNGIALDARAETLYFVTSGGRLAALRDRRLRLLRRLEGFDGGLSVPAPGVLVFTGARAVSVARPDGTLVARATWSSRRAVLDSGVSASRDGRSFAYRLSDARPRARRSTASVYVIRTGTRGARLVFRHRLGPTGCAVGASLSWSGRFLLYSAFDGTRAVVDTSSGRATALTALARALPALSHGERASLAWRATSTSRRRGR